MGNTAAVLSRPSSAVSKRSQNGEAAEVTQAVLSLENGIEQLGDALKFKPLDLTPLPPLTTFDEVIAHPSAQRHIIGLIQAHPVGTANRWEAILKALNRQTAPTYSQPQPLNFELTQATLLRVVAKCMSDVSNVVDIPGLSLAREIIPQIYKGHKVDYMESVSRKDRENMKLFDPMYAYGELPIEIFCTIFTKIDSILSLPSGGLFYDLGCGVGQLVYTVALLGSFDRQIGIELIPSVLRRATERQRLFTEYMKVHSVPHSNAIFEWIEKDFLIANFWTDASFIVLHWTAYSASQRASILETIKRCNEGTLILCFNLPVVLESSFITLYADSCDTSYGQVDFFLLEKISPYHATVTRNIENMKSEVVSSLEEWDNLWNV